MFNPQPKKKRIVDKNKLKEIRSIGYCEVCGSTHNLEAHHIKTVASGGNDTDDNLITVCFYCHKKAHDGNIPKNKLKDIIANRLTPCGGGIRR